MDSKIQQLTETIYNEGVEKAREEADAILKEANEKAEQIEKDAQKKADKIVEDANGKSEELKKQVDSEIKMTLNQAVSAMKQEITSLITMQVIQPSVKELFSNSDYLKKLISDVVKGWMDKEDFDLNVILPESEREDLEKFFKNNLADELNKGLEVSFAKNLKSGFKIGPSDGSYVISFTDEDFINFLKSYLRPKTSQLLFEEEK
ncbi:V/A-type H+-transporting ATPase subunit E [Tangfeifania diversioriginum]|uniref:V/A-type H+-transporting ATPase subunit E n=1 Tax=Tangfeifania diversioriginum TaxID=1168035 RepID=A0A1M6M1W1_9BACT|nr:V-type ATP synthase subunit E [Tangfeifania diversioriginum]SHJ77376.1 V/A-type H+-transporting ATPase subunit E [Tangfeifania diversioriginum]